jgi:dCMP deaminase
MEILNWNDYFMNIAQQVSLRSPDPKKQVGVVIVNNQNRIVSTGYNGLPSKFSINDKTLDWTDREFISSIIIHAECNALLYLNSSFKFSELKIYSTLSPCSECLKLIKACNINKVFYKEKYKNYEQTVNTSKMFDIELIQL